jgi:hypothetical protein
MTDRKDKTLIEKMKAGGPAGYQWLYRVQINIWKKDKYQRMGEKV